MIRTCISQPYHGPKYIKKGFSILSLNPQIIRDVVNRRLVLLKMQYMQYYAVLRPENQPDPYIIMATLLTTNITATVN